MNPSDRFAISKQLLPIAVISTFAAFTLTPGAAQAATIALNVDVATALGSNPTQLYYSMDTINTGTPDTMSDFSGNGNTGTIDDGAENVPPTSVAGKFNNALHVQGTPTIAELNPYLYASATANSSLDLTGMSFTMGMWLNFDSIRTGGGYNQYLFVNGRQGIAASPGYAFFLGASSTPGNWAFFFETRNGASLNQVSSGNQHFDFQTDQWYHVGMSFDNVTKAVRFYLNGEDVGGGTSTVDIADGTEFLYLGERGTSSYNGWFDGAYDDAFITSGVYDFGPVPEPSSSILLGLGIATLLLRRKRAA